MISRGLSQSRLISIDINDLKEVNDNMGHLKGDKLIKHSAKLLSSF
jgi:GGDEF domain-containing protein